MWGVLPLERDISWETHLAGGLIGLLLALALRHRDPPVRRVYSWEAPVANPAAWPTADDPPVWLDPPVGLVNEAEAPTRPPAPRRADALPES